jgi:hypothetical protein
MWTDLATVATAAFTAVAAGAAWWSVRQGQRLWRTAQEADLVVQILQNTQAGATDLVIPNVGGGVARGVAFALAVDGRKGCRWCW